MMRETCHACGSGGCPAAGKDYVDDCPVWQEAEARNGRGEYLMIGKIGSRAAAGAEEIIRNIAARTIVNPDGSCWFCSADADDVDQRDTDLHWSGCLWRQAVEWVNGRP